MRESVIEGDSDGERLIERVGERERVRKRG